MTDSVKDQINVLVKLQDIEIQRSKTEVEVDRIAKQIDGLDTELVQWEAKITENETRLAELNKAYRAHESDIEANQARMAKSQEKLDSVKNNKEYQSILKEMDDLKVKNSSIEDQMIECLNRMDDAQEKIESMRQEYSAFSEKIKSEKEEIYQQIEQGKKELENLQGDWESVSQTVDPELMKHYIELKDKVQGSAVAPVVKAVCDGCHMNIPPQTYNELQRFDSLKYCPFCHRLIYWQN